MTEVRVLFVCLGNICRSPLAKGVAQKMAAQLSQPVVVVDSADLSDHRARKVQKSDYEEFDFVVAMDASNLRDLKRKCPPQHAHKLSLLLSHSERHRGEDVPDPYYGHPSFEAVYDIVEDGVRGFFSSVLAASTDA